MILFQAIKSERNIEKAFVWFFPSVLCRHFSRLTANFSQTADSYSSWESADSGLSPFSMHFSFGVALFAHVEKDITERRLSHLSFALKCSVSLTQMHVPLQPYEH